MEGVKYLACEKCGLMPHEFVAKRLRRVCRALDLQMAVPDDDLELYRCMVSVLGLIARRIEERNRVEAPHETARPNEQ